MNPFYIYVVVISIFNTLLIIHSKPNPANLGFNVYPWRNIDFHHRSAQLLRTMRANVDLEVADDTFNFEGINSFNQNNSIDEPVFYIRNKDHQLFQVKKRNEKKELKSNDQKDAKSMRHLYDVNLMNSALTDLCAVLQVDYWTYEWCYKKELRQFHIEQTGEAFVRSPDWSLGKYSRTIIIRKNGDSSNASAPITKMVEYFVEGQKCDENGNRRHTEVTIQCCEGLPVNNYIPVDVYFSQQNKRQSNLPAATLSTINEPDLCSYKATVCTPLLCEQHQKKHNPIMKKNEDSLVNPKITRVMRSLNNTCILKPEDWWTYELCFNKGVRQVKFIYEQTPLPDGSIQQKQVVASQFQLGLPILDIYINETALQERTNPGFFNNIPGGNIITTREAELMRSVGMVPPIFKLKGQDPKYLVIEFNNGTPCDLDHVNRSTIVELHCGQNVEIMNILEDSTCHYL
eukprot:gene14827-19920_t